MDKSERKERALAALEIAAAAVSHAERNTEGSNLVPKSEALRCHDAIGKLQIRLTRELDK